METTLSTGRKNMAEGGPRMIMKVTSANTSRLEVPIGSENG